MVRLRLPPDTVERHLVGRRLLGPLVGKRVLDVGGRPGQAAAFFPEATVVAANVDEPADVLLDAAVLPFADVSFDAVLSMDVLEHVEPQFRQMHIEELIRVTRGPVLVATPFGTDEHRAVEEDLRAWYRARAGRSHTFLDEHLAFGLIDAEAVASLVAMHDFAACYHGDARRAATIFRATLDLRTRPWRALPLFRELLRWPDTSLSSEPHPYVNRVFLIRS